MCVHEREERRNAVSTARMHTASGNFALDAGVGRSTCVKNGYANSHTALLGRSNHDLFLSKHMCWHFFLPTNIVVP
jgi:hypothetical protein